MNTIIKGTSPNVKFNKLDCYQNKKASTALHYGIILPKYIYAYIIASKANRVFKIEHLIDKQS